MNGAGPRFSSSFLSFQMLYSRRAQWTRCLPGPRATLPRAEPNPQSLLLEVGFTQPLGISSGDSRRLEPAGDWFWWYSLMEEAVRGQEWTMAVHVEDPSSCTRVSRMQSSSSLVAISDCEEDAQSLPMRLPELIPYHCHFSVDCCGQMPN
jgi:hypothetical protein